MCSRLTIVMSSANSGSALLLAVFQLWVLQIHGEIRCYCNLPLCVTTGYMCKSTSNACFSELTSQSDLSRTRHGCVELLHRPKRELCFTRLRTGKGNAAKYPLLLCCPEDMCNYIDNLGLRIQVNTKGNQTYMTGVDERGYFYGNAQDAALRQDLWFKAAVIAVPIAGGFILVMLVLLAVHMLRKDSKRQRQMMELRRQRQFKMQLLLNEQHPPERLDHYVERREHCSDKYHLFPEKNEVNAARNKLETQGTLYKNMNLAFSRDSSFNEKQYIHDKSLHHTLCSLVSWSQMNWKTSTPV